MGPIEHALHPNRGYGSEHCAQAMRRLRRLGATWVSITPFGRIWDLQPGEVDLSFEAPFQENRRGIERAVAQAHEAGLKVLLVPHLWAETGKWRGEIDPGSEEAWAAWAKGYTRFVTTWATVAEHAGVDLLSMGVELRTWVTTEHAPLFFDTIARVRQVYSGPLTYAANWDDAERTTVWGALDVIGINAFYPLAKEPNASPEALLKRSTELAGEVETWVEGWQKPVLFLEIGYTTRPDPALRPWEWPEDLGQVRLDTSAQAEAYQALIAPFVQQPWFAGFFVWRVFPDLYDVSQEPDWGFSPLGKEAELVVRDAFLSRWAADGPPSAGAAFVSFASRHPGLY